MRNPLLYLPTTEEQYLSNKGGQQGQCEKASRASISFAEAGALVTVLAASIYVLGIVAFGVQIFRLYTENFSSALYTTSLAPRTVIAAYGVRSFVIPWVIVTVILAFYGLTLGRRSISGQSTLFIYRPRWFIAIFAPILFLALFTFVDADWPSITFLTVGTGLFLLLTAIWAGWAAGKSFEDAWEPSEEGLGLRRARTRSLVNGIVLCFVVALLASVPAAGQSKSRLPSVAITHDGGKTYCGDLIGHLDTFWYLFRGGEKREDLVRRPTGIPDASVDKVVIFKSHPGGATCEKIPAA